MIKTNGGFLISQIKAVQGRVFEKLLIKSGVDEFNGAQGRILYVLWQEDNLPIVELSKRTGLAKTTLTSMLDRLENKGFLLRCGDKKNRRQIRIVLTEKSKDLEDKYKEVSDKMSEIFYCGFSDDEIKEFESKLNRILENLKEK
jgi:DNA-binding MarR family transcriptional regulator